jgi:uncharacterized protein YndB with AHSA1/START domain
MRNLVFTLLACLLAPSAFAEGGLRFETRVPASIEEVWTAWTTVEGIKSFFAPGANIDLKPDGAYEIFFDPSQPAGSRGADGMKILLVQRPLALAFTWNAPPKFVEQRRQRTHVMVRLFPISDRETRVVLTHDGFGEGEEWAAVRGYFERAWRDVVLPRLVKRFQ